MLFQNQPPSIKDFVSEIIKSWNYKQTTKHIKKKGQILSIKTVLQQR